jgi:outer membrane protein TolC
VKRALITLCLACSSAALAQPATLQEFLDAAQSNNVDQRLTLEQVKKAHADSMQAWTVLLPSLTLQGTWTDSQYAAIATLPVSATQFVTLTITPKDQIDGVARIDLPLINTTAWLRAKASNESELATIERQGLTRDLVKRQIVSAFYSYAASLSLRDSAKRSYDVADKQLALTDIRTRAGSATELELLRAKAEVARNRQTVADTETLVATSRRSLQTLSGVTPADVVTMPPDDMRPEAGFAELEQRIGELPAVRAAAHDDAAVDALKLSSRLALVPTAGFNFTERLTNATGFTGKWNAYSLGVNLTWRLDAPTFYGWDSADSNQRATALAAEKTRLQSKDQIHSDWQRLNAALIKVEAAASQVESAKRAAQVARDKYAVGAATQVDVITAERDLFSAEVGQIQARTELATARASLRLSAALPLQ